MMGQQTATTALYKLFNNQVSELINELMNICPSVIKIKEINIMFEVAKNLDPKLPLETFAEQVLAKYETQLREHSESFFLGHDFGDEVPSSWNTLVKTLRNLWESSLDAPSKESMWKYMDNLMAITDRVKN